MTNIILQGGFGPICMCSENLMRQGIHQAGKLWDSQPFLWDHHVPLIMLKAVVPECLKTGILFKLDSADLYH